MAIPQIGGGGDVSNSIRFSGCQSCALDRPGGLLMERRALQLAVHWIRQGTSTARGCNHRFFECFGMLTRARASQEAVGNYSRRRASMSGVNQPNIPLFYPQPYPQGLRAFAEIQVGATGFEPAT
ncbi:hypothetical protein [Prochlorococcus marinus]|uniref:hypothetical protein n=1 Tax=Prochlorococcus marinus TaxID=1219 RepID=UPI001F340F3B|nr:hypothetical protein [Prochlorococcus marinus]